MPLAICGDMPYKPAKNQRYPGLTAVSLVPDRGVETCNGSTLVAR